MPHVRPLSVVESALRASDAGIADAENARRHGVAVKTIRRWRRDYQRRGRPRGQQHLAPPCPRCDNAPLDEVAYAELLGWYLGDGHISSGRREVWNLHVVNDARYVDDIDQIAHLMGRVKPGGRPHRRIRPGAVIVTCSWKHWLCLFPQHGPGRKHERPILLEEWQRILVEEHPGELLRGLFHSDGSRVRNWATRVVAGERKRYELSAMAVQQPVIGHSRSVLLGTRPRRDPLATLKPLDRERFHPRRGRSPRCVDRPEELTELTRDGTPAPPG